MPICLGGFVSYFAQDDKTAISVDSAYWYASGIVLSSAFMIISYHPTILYIFKAACEARIACGGLVYHKALQLTKSSAADCFNGKIINLLSNDLSKFEIGLGFLHDLWKGPVEALAFFFVIYKEIGYAGALGMAFLVSFIPLQGEQYFYEEAIIRLQVNYF